VNTSLLLAHTARRFIEVGFRRGSAIWHYRTWGQQRGRSRNKVAVGEPAAGSPP